MYAKRITDGDAGCTDTYVYVRHVGLMPDEQLDVSLMLPEMLAPIGADTTVNWPVEGSWTVVAGTRLSMHADQTPDHDGIQSRVLVRVPVVEPARVR